MRKIITTGMIFFVIILALLLQINLFNVVPLFGITANIGIVLITGIGLMSGKTVGGITGAFYGLLVDIIFSNAIGINILLYTLVGIFTGQISRGFSKDTKMAMAFMVCIATVLFEFASVFLLSWLQDRKIEFIQVVFVILLEAIYNMVLTILFHRVIVGLGELINKSKNSYYLL